MFFPDWTQIAVEPHTSLATLLLIFLLLCFNSTPTHSSTPYIIIKRNTISDFHIGKCLKDVDRKLKGWRWEDLYCKISAVLIFTSDKSSPNEESIWFWVSLDSIAILWQQTVPQHWKETWEFWHLVTDMGHCLSNSSTVTTQLTDTSLQFTSPARGKSAPPKISTKDRASWISWLGSLTFFSMSRCKALSLNISLWISLP